MQQEPSKIKGDILSSVQLLYLFFLILVGVILVRLVAVQFFCEETRINAERLSKRIFVEQKIDARRGSILARHGEPLAISIFRYNPLFDFDSEGFADTTTFFKQSDSLAQLLSAYFGDRSPRAYAELLQGHWRRERSRVKRYVERDTSYYNEELSVVPLLFRLMAGTAKIERRVRDTIRFHRPITIFPREVDYTEWEQLSNFPILNYNMGYTYRLDKHDRRIYPQGDLARRTIGRRTDNDSTSYGLELICDSLLRGEDGSSLRQRIARGFSTRVGEEHRAAVDGLDVVTTIDLTLQDVADKALRRQLEEQNADWGTTLVMEVATGDLVAMVNLGRSSKGVLYERENYALGRSMEPGSTLKLATMLALLDEAGMSPDKEYETNNGEKVQVGPARDIQDSHKGDHRIALKRAVAGSSNVYFARAYWEYYGQTGRKQALSDYLHGQLGLGERVGFEALGERKPSLTTDWRVPDPGVMLVKMAYGYRVELTPIQLLTLYNGIANGGRKVAPRLIREIRCGDEVVEQFPTRVLREQLCTPQTLRIVQECLEEVSKSGTAAPFFSDTTHLRVAAKTGTAQVTSGAKGRYLGSMVAYFPAEQPRYTVLTTICTHQQPGKAYYGASLAGPVVKRVVDYIYASEQTWSEPLAAEPVQQPSNRLAGGSVEALEEVTTTLPDVCGLGLRDALFQLERGGLQVKIVGSGVVVRQMPQAGAPLRPGTEVTIWLK